MHKAMNHIYNSKHYSNEEDEEEEDRLMTDSPVKIEQLEILPPQNEEIAVISTSMPLMRTISFTSSIAFLLLLFSRFYFNVKQLSFLFISIPLLITIISLILYLNSSIMLQSMTSKGKQSRLHSFLYYLCLNSAGISLLIFICLVSLRLDRLVMNGYLTIIKPFIFSGTIYLVYSLIILPIANDNINWFINAITAIDAICAMLIAYFFLNDNGDNNNTPNCYSIAFAVCYLAVIVNCIPYWMNGIQDKEECIKIAGIGFIALGIVVFNIKISFSIMKDDSHWMEIALGIIGYLMICFNFINGTFKEDIILIKKSADTKFV